MFRPLTTLCAAAAAVLLSASPLLAGSLSPIGSWQVSTGEARYKVVSCGKQGQICAKLVWLRDDAKTSENLQYLNKYVVKGAVPARENKWTGTVNYEGQSIGGSVVMVNDTTMRLTGCKLIACRSMEFKRI